MIKADECAWLVCEILRPGPRATTLGAEARVAESALLEGGHRRHSSRPATGWEAPGKDTARATGRAPRTGLYLTSLRMTSCYHRGMRHRARFAVLVSAGIAALLGSPAGAQGQPITLYVPLHYAMVVVASPTEAPSVRVLDPQGGVRATAMTMEPTADGRWIAAFNLGTTLTEWSTGVVSRCLGRYPLSLAGVNIAETRCRWLAGRVERMPAR